MRTIVIIHEIERKQVVVVRPGIGIARGTTGGKVPVFFTRSIAVITTNLSNRKKNHTKRKHSHSKDGSYDLCSGDSEENFNHHTQTHYFEGNRDRGI